MCGLKAADWPVVVMVVSVVGFGPRPWWAGARAGSVLGAGAWTGLGLVVDHGALVVRAEVRAVRGAALGL